MKLILYVMELHTAPALSRFAAFFNRNLAFILTQGARLHNCLTVKYCRTGSICQKALFHADNWNKRV